MKENTEKMIERTEQVSEETQRIADESPIEDLNDFPLSPPKPVRTKHAFHPVTAEEFAEVSSLVKGRTKLADVNKVYETIYNYAKGHKRGYGSCDIHPKGKNRSAFHSEDGRARLQSCRANVCHVEDISQQRRSSFVHFTFSQTYRYDQRRSRCQTLILPNELLINAEALNLLRGFAVFVFQSQCQ